MQIRAVITCRVQAWAGCSSDFRIRVTWTHPLSLNGVSSVLREASWSHEFCCLVTRKLPVTLWSGVGGLDALLGGELRNPDLRPPERKIFFGIIDRRRESEG